MSQVAHYRFLTNNMLTTEEREHKEEVIKLTGELLDTRGIECESKIMTVSLDELKEILEVRKIYKKKNKRTIIKKSSDNTEPVEEEQIQYIC
jgi:hypothetical protein